MSTDLTLTLPKRPAVGVQGRAVVVRTNYYEIDQVPEGPHYHYDCKITNKVLTGPTPVKAGNAKAGKAGKAGKSGKDEIPPEKSLQIIRQYVEKDLQSKIRVAYDGENNMYSYAKLPQDKLMSEVTFKSPGGSSDVYKIVLELVNTNPMDALNNYLRGVSPADSDEVAQYRSSLNYLDVMLHQWPAQRYTASSKNIYRSQGAIRMGGGLDVWLGAFQSIRMGGVGMDGKPTGKLVLNIDAVSAAFRRAGNLVDMMAEFLGRRPDDFLRSRGLSRRQIDDVNKEYCGVEIELIHRGERRPRYRIDGFSSVTADKIKFKDDQTNKELTVAEYFKKQYNRQLKFGACLPCVVVNKKTDLYFPIEVCRIVEGQRKKQLGPRATAEFIKIACTRPDERERKIRQDATRQIDFENNPDLKAWGLHVDISDLMTLKARVLSVPTLIYDPASSKSQLVPKDGAWNIVGQKVPVGSKLTSWAIAAFGSEQEMPTPSITRFVQQLVSVAASRGLNIVNKNPTVVRANNLENPNVVLDKAYSFAEYRDPATNQNGPPQLIMCLLDGKAKQSQLYSPCKKWGDCKEGVVTQCISYSQLQAQRSPDQYCNNLFLKLNQKMGGVNLKLAPGTLGKWANGPCMIIGCDVTHGPPKSRSPSIAVLAATMDNTFGRYAVEYRIQPPHREIIDHFGAMLKSLLKQFLPRSGNNKPERILVFRDGVSDGMFEIIKEIEIDAIKRTCLELSPKFKPAITVVAVQKRHHTRFFPTDQNKDRSQNCLPGTVVDTVIAHPHEFDFFLQSHAGIQGTSRPTHYQVLHDEYGFQADELQNLCYRLCYTYGRCTRSVSVVPPVFYADMAGYRIRTHLKDYSRWSEESRRTSDSQEDPSLLFEPLNQRLKGRMWFV